MKTMKMGLPWGDVIICLNILEGVFKSCCRVSNDCIITDVFFDSVKHRHNSYNCKDFCKISLASISRCSSYFEINGITALVPTIIPNILSGGIDWGSLQGTNEPINVLKSQNEKFAGFRLLIQIEARMDAVDRLKGKKDD